MMNWHRVSTNDRHILRSCMTICEFRRIKYNYSNDNLDYPPTVFMYCEQKEADQIRNSLGIYRK